MLTFLGALPSSLQLGYVNYQLEKYIPKPLQCRKCWRLRHSTQHCRSKQTCSLCTSTEHDRSSCTAPGPTCINCRGAHEATSTTCPLLIYEQKVCAYQSDTKVSYTEAGRQLPPPTIRNHPTALEQPLEKQPQHRTPQPQVPHSSRLNLNTSTEAFMQEDEEDTDHMAPDIFSTTAFPVLTEPPHNRHQQQKWTKSFPSTTPHSSYPLTAGQPSPNTSPSQLTPGQRQENPKSTLDHDIFTQESLPSLPTQESTFFKNPHSVNRSYNLASGPTNVHLDNRAPDSNLASLIPHLLPLLIRLLFATNLQEKIDSCTKIGQLFNLDSLITTTLASLNLTTTTTQP